MLFFRNLCIIVCAALVLWLEYVAVSGMFSSKAIGEAAAVLFVAASVAGAAKGSKF